MAMFDFLKKKKEKERFSKKEEKKAAPREHVHEEEKTLALKEKNEFSKKAWGILVRPHITEKSTMAQEVGSYVFEVDDSARKPQIKEAVKELYGVNVEKVNLVKIPAKEKFSRGRWGHKPGYKKAIVFLAKGERIEII